jgi:hypothetical protein
MDKFDQSIKNAKVNIEPSTNFVDSTMTKINSHKVKPRFGFRLWMPILGSLVVAAILFMVFSSGSNTFSSKTPAQKTSKNTTSQSATNNTPPPSGTNNSALVSYLSGIDGSINQENSDQNSANSAINDSSSEITVPTD